MSGRYVQIATSGTGTLNKANDYGIPISGKHSLALDVMGCKNAYLFLSNTSTIGKSSGNYYEVALSIGANGTVSLINDGCFSCKSKALVVKRVLNCTAFKTFRVTWFRKGSLEVREGSNTSSRLLLSSSRLSEIELNYLHLVSPGQKVVWRIYVGNVLVILYLHHFLSFFLSFFRNKQEGRNEMFYLSTHSTHFIYGYMERERKMFYLTTHSTHFIYGYMASDIWLRTILIVRKETRCRHIGYCYRLTARVLPTDRIAHTTAFVTPVVEHWLEREISK